MKYDVLINGTRHIVSFVPQRDSPSRITAIIDNRRVEADAVKILPSTYSILLDGRSLEVTVENATDGLVLRVAGIEFHVEIADPRSWRDRRSGHIELEGRQEVTAPMPGKVVTLLVAPGQNVEAGQGLLVIEAMKMQNEIRSPKSGTVERLLVKEGQTVSPGEALAVVT
jgi:biotin carboxyl carrier protein